ncbi:Hsp20/alpha crystallin family protein [Duganella margarita]|nr:Hsp20/alpha crystallin family protein [Duganella margarita]
MMATSNLTRYTPSSPLGLFEPLRALEELLRDTGMEPFWPSTELAAGIRMDIQETEQAYQIRADMPGLKKEDIKVAVDGRQVSLSAQAEQGGQGEQGGMLWRERHAGQWQRSFTLPQEVDDSQAAARYEDGVLHLTLPKKAGTGGTRLTIQ